MCVRNSLLKLDFCNLGLQQYIGMHIGNYVGKNITLHVSQSMYVIYDTLFSRIGKSKKYHIDVSIDWVGSLLPYAFV